jgi:hypothetical protein
VIAAGRTILPRPPSGHIEVVITRAPGLRGGLRELSERPVWHWKANARYYRWLELIAQRHGFTSAEDGIICLMQEIVGSPVTGGSVSYTPDTLKGGQAA